MFVLLFSDFAFVICYWVVLILCLWVWRFWWFGLVIVLVADCLVFCCFWVSLIWVLLVCWILRWLGCLGCTGECGVCCLSLLSGVYLWLWYCFLFVIWFGVSGVLLSWLLNYLIYVCLIVSFLFLCFFVCCLLLRLNWGVCCDAEVLLFDVAVVSIRLVWCFGGLHITCVISLTDVFCWYFRLCGLLNVLISCLFDLIGGFGGLDVVTFSFGFAWFLGVYGIAGDWWFVFVWFGWFSLYFIWYFIVLRLNIVYFTVVAGLGGFAMSCFLDCLGCLRCVVLL